MSNLEGKVIAITGAGQGLGRAASLALSQAGAKVALLGRTLSKLESVCEAANGEVMALETDVGNPDSVNAAFERIGAHWGGVDMLINNAAWYPIFKIESATDDQINQSINANFIGAVYCIRAAIPQMRAKGGGHIINVSSESVHSPIPFLTLYAAGKAGLEVLTRGLKTELRPDNIRVTLLRIGGIADPDKTTAQFDPAVAAEFRKAFVESGARAMVGGGVKLETITAKIQEILELSDEASIDELELRSR